ncbi:hypothetical protein [Antrihabitans cavernicola]|uniref:DUF445 family protein n=1 Tax=Antrihabitans cavernicola TaxID=2495913 RepID=A0A5A7SHX2_9NOCA|nr:hypothetical protein [Spelaeibacter cavernicola]KAA0023821.1 hypothetical protein FOY51_04270 [Spelaeibacter cavernicola]
MLQVLFGVENTLLLELITVPLFTGIIGYITNWTGILMLFKPLQFHGFRLLGLKTLFPFLPKKVQVLPLIRYDGRLGWQGIVPSRADKMASIAVDKGLAKLGSVRDFYRELQPEAIAEQLTKVAQGQIRGIVEEIIERENPQLWHNLPGPVKEAVHARVRQQLPAIVADITDQIGENIDQLLDIKLMVIKYFSANPELLNELFLIMGRKELRFMQNFGFYFGFPCGFLLVAVLHFTHWTAWLVLPIGGIIIGWVVNYIGISLIFEPVFPKWYCPWRQGLLLKRQPEITELYAKMVASKVVTISNVGEELMTGPRSDRTHQMLEETIRPATDRALGPAKTMVRVAMGTREYDHIKASLATEATAFAPIAFADEEFNVQQSEKVYKFIAKQMAAMGPDDFVQMLRSAIKQDEWLLFVHGGVLGLFAGFLHIFIFGV